MNLIDRTRAYFHASKEELLAVTWPTRQDIIRYTVLVIAAVIAFGIFFSILDFLINKGIQAVIVSQNQTTQNNVAPTDSTPFEINPVNVEATSPDGTPANIQVEQVPIEPVAPAPEAAPAN